MTLRAPEGDIAPFFFPVDAALFPVDAAPQSKTFLR
jgi:hypothetical protein